MTTAKQVKANQANSKKSTGAKTEQGKQAVANNAVKHGIFSTRLIMSFESVEEYAELLDGLIDSLHPVGTVEQLLVEKVAVAMWRQLRLTRAESASIEMGRSVNKYTIRNQVQDIACDDYESLSTIDFMPETEAQKNNVKWCKQVIKEFTDNLENGKLSDLEHIRQAPKIIEQLETETKQDDQESVQSYIDTLSGGLEAWVFELIEWCELELKKAESKSKQYKEISQALEIVQAKESAPIKNDLIMRYQAALDGELYKALAALRKQQEWRLTSGDIIEAAAG